MTQTQQEEVNLLKELIADTSISADERTIYEDALSELMKSEKPKATTERKRLINDISEKATTERKPRTTTKRKPQAPKQSKSDIELAKAEIKRRTGKTEEECESIVNEYRSLRAKSVERKKKESVASAENKDRVAKLKKDDKIISGTSEKTADAVIESTTKDVAEKIVKEIDKIEQKAEIEATKEVKKEMPKESTTEQNKVIAEKTEEKVKAQTKTIVKRIVIDTSSLLSSIAESLGKFDKDSQKEFLIKLRSDIDKLLTKYSYGGSTMGATQGYNITQSNLSSSSVNPTMFNGGGGVGNPSKKEMLDYLNMYFDNYSELRTIAIEEDNILTRKMLNSLDDEELEMAYDDAKYEIKADTQFNEGGGVGNTNAISYNGQNALTSYQKNNIQDIQKYFGDNGTLIEFVAMNNRDSSSGMTFAITINGRGLYASDYREKAMQVYKDEILKYKYANGGGVDKYKIDFQNFTIDEFKSFVKSINPYGEIEISVSLGNNVNKGGTYSKRIESKKIKDLSMSIGDAGREISVSTSSENIYADILVYDNNYDKRFEEYTISLFSKDAKKDLKFVVNSIIEKFKRGGGVEEKEDYFFDEDDYENN